MNIAIVGASGNVGRKHLEDKEKPGLLVTSTSATNGKKPDAAVQNMRKQGAKVARVSGWCAFAKWALRGVDAGFPISDHADFSDTMKFVEACNPKQGYTVHGSTKELAKQIEKKYHDRLFHLTVSTQLEQIFIVRFITFHYNSNNYVLVKIMSTVVQRKLILFSNVLNWFFGIISRLIQKR